MSEFEMKVDEVIKAWTAKTDSPVCDSVRISWVMEQWPELGKALQSLAEVDYEPLMTESEMSKHVRREVTEMVGNIYTEEDAIKQVQEQNVHNDMMSALTSVNQIAGTPG